MYIHVYVHRVEYRMLNLLGRGEKKGRRREGRREGGGRGEKGGGRGEKGGGRGETVTHHAILF